MRNPVYVALVDEKGYPHKGHMDFVDNQIDLNTATIRGRAILENKNLVLAPGLFVKLRLPGSDSYKAILIPDSAIGHDQSEKFVYVVDSGNKVKRQVVVIGPISNGLRIVRTGLTGSEKIIVRGLQRVFPGAQVQFTEEKIKATSEEGLPNTYQPVPPEKWLSRRPAKTPKGIEFNNQKHDSGERK